MKSLAYLSAISTALIATLLATGSVRAQYYPYGGASSNTTIIYAPSTETTTTITTTIPQLSPGVYLDGYGTTIYTGGRKRFRNNYYRVDRQPIIIIGQPNIYTIPARNSCSTSIIGSPIPSAIPLDRSGRPCQ